MSSYTISPKLKSNRVFILQKSELEKRLDPKFYANDYKENLAKIKYNNYKRLGEIVKFSSETWNQKDFFENTFPYIEISEIDTLSGEIQNITQVDKSEAASRAKMVVRENDIIISTTRPNRGAIALIKKEQDFSIASTGFSVIRNITNPDIDRQYLFAILRQQIILKQFEQRSSGGNYPAITQEELSNVIIPFANKEKQTSVVKIFNNCFAEKQKNEAEAEKLLSSIDDYLLNELGITLPTPSENTLRNRMFYSSLRQLSGNRLDPFFYNVSFNKLVDRIHKGKFKVDKLGSVCSNIDTGNTPSKSTYVESDEENILPIIKAGSYTGNFIDIDKSDFVKSDFSGNTVSKGDIFILGAAHQAEYVGKKVYYLNEVPKQKTFFVGELVRITANPNKCDNSFLFSILKTKLYMDLLNREKRGQTSHLYPKDVKHIFIPIPPLDKQQEIANHITDIRQQAQQLKDKTKELLKTASEEIEKILLT